MITNSTRLRRDPSTGMLWAANLGRQALAYEAEYRHGGGRRPRGDQNDHGARNAGRNKNAASKTRLPEWLLATGHDAAAVAAGRQSASLVPELAMRRISSAISTEDRPAAPRGRASSPRATGSRPPTAASALSTSKYASTPRRASPRECDDGATTPRTAGDERRTRAPVTRQVRATISEGADRDAMLAAQGHCRLFAQVAQRQVQPHQESNRKAHRNQVLLGLAKRAQLEDAAEQMSSPPRSKWALNASAPAPLSASPHAGARSLRETIQQQHEGGLQQGGCSASITPRRARSDASLYGPWTTEVVPCYKGWSTFSRVFGTEDANRRRLMTAGQHEAPRATVSV